MSSREEIFHPGIIESVEGSNIRVKILAQSACSTCHAKGMCSVADMKEKIVDVPGSGNESYRQGDRVMLVMKKSLGARAVLLGYFLPFLMVVATLVVLLYFTENEGMSALISILLLGPYYLLLYLLKDRLSKEFIFKIDTRATN